MTHSDVSAVLDGEHELSTLPANCPDSVATMTNSAIPADTPMNPEESELREQAARTIQKAYKAFVAYRDAQEPNQFGITFTKNLHPLHQGEGSKGGEESPKSKARKQAERLRRYHFKREGSNYVLANLEKGIDSRHGLNGADKRCVIVGKNTLSFVTSKPWNPETPPFQEDLKKLDRLVIPQWLNTKRMVMRNAGIDLMRHDGPVALKGFQQLVTQLNEMHSLRYCHMDIKLNNLCIDTHGEISLIDCDGIKWMLRPEPLVYTPGYMPATCVADIKRGAQGLRKSMSRLMLMDQYAMLCCMIQATLSNLGLTPEERLDFIMICFSWILFNKQLVMRPADRDTVDFKQADCLSPSQVIARQLDTLVYIRNTATERVIDRWIKKYVKPEHISRITLLLTHPKLHLETFRGKPLPLHEMLNWDEN